MLAALFFRLGVEQRAREVGLLRAVGFSTPRVGRLFAAEGLLLAVIGSIIGMAGAVAYGAALMAGLRTWWSGAVGTTALTLHVSPISLLAGAAGAIGDRHECRVQWLELGNGAPQDLLALVVLRWEELEREARELGAQVRGEGSIQVHHGSTVSSRS